jgi:hypothetical protein
MTWLGLFGGGDFLVLHVILWDGVRGFLSYGMARFARRSSGEVECYQILHITCVMCAISRTQNDPRKSVRHRRNGHIREGMSHEWEREKDDLKGGKWIQITHKFAQMPLRHDLLFDAS